MITRASSDLRMFWTAYDPLDLASGSIDVLWFQRGYIALADKILLGFTTVTTSPRYLRQTRDFGHAYGLLADRHPLRPCGRSAGEH